MESHDLERRAARHAALGDPARLAIVDALTASDRSPVELRRLLGLESNLLAHHLDVLESAGLVRRSHSSGDRRRRYVHLRHDALGGLTPGRRIAPTRALFVCSANSARSQLAAALWRSITSAPAASAGTHPAAHVHPGAVAAASRAGLEMAGAAPRSLDSVRTLAPLVITVCDQAHEELAEQDDREGWLHWSIPDPVPVGTPRAFDEAVREIKHRIAALVQVRGVAS